MRYKPRPGVVLTKICGVHLLVPTREASVECPNISRLSLLGIAAWDVVTNNRSIQDLYRMQQILSRTDEASAKEYVDAFLQKMCDNGFLIQVDDDE